MKCTKCGNIMHITEWKPSPGMDLKLREFHCPKGHPSFYARPNAFDWKCQVADYQAERIRSEKRRQFQYQPARRQSGF